MIEQGNPYGHDDSDWEQALRHAEQSRMSAKVFGTPMDRLYRYGDGHRHPDHHGRIDDTFTEIPNAIPGSLDDWHNASKGGLLHGESGEWGQRNRELVAKVACNAVECCGEWQRPGYHGWCSLLGYLPHGFDSKRICPIAARYRDRGIWLVELLDELELICEGEIDVWTGYGSADGSINEG